MAQHNYVISNASFPNVRSEINNVLSAINSSNSGTSRPSSATTGTIWLDTTNSGSNSLSLKFFDGAQDIELAIVDTSANTVNFLDSVTSGVADNSITLAKLASGTDGNIISYDASGNPVAVATGSSGQVLVSAGAGAVPSFQTVSGNATHSGEVTGSGALTIADNIVDEANLKVSNSPTNGYVLSAQSGNSGGLTWAEVGGGGMTLLNTVNVSSGVVSNIQTGAIFSSTYNSYRIVFDKFKHSDPSALYFQIGNSSGVQGSYNWSSMGLNANSSQLTGATNGSSIRLYGGDANNDYKSNSNQGMPAGFIDVFNPFVSGANTIIRSQLSWGNASNNNAQQASVAGLVLNGTQYDRFKIDISNGYISNVTKILTYGYNL